MIEIVLIAVIALLIIINVVTLVMMYKFVTASKKSDQEYMRALMARDLTDFTSNTKFETQKEIVTKEPDAIPVELAPDLLFNKFIAEENAPVKADDID